VAFATVRCTVRHAVCSVFPLRFANDDDFPLDYLVLVARDTRNSNGVVPRPALGYFAMHSPYDPSNHIPFDFWLRIIGESVYFIQALAAVPRPAQSSLSSLRSLRSLILWSRYALLDCPNCPDSCYGIHYDLRLSFAQIYPRFMQIHCIS
jgi:hypothetical protein